MFLDVAVAGCNACGVRRPLTIIDDRERLKLPSQTLFFGFLILSLRKTRIVLDATARSSERDQLSDGQKELVSVLLVHIFLKYQKYNENLPARQQVEIARALFFVLFLFFVLLFFVAAAAAESSAPHVVLVTGASGLIGRVRFRRWWLPSRQQGRGLLEMSGGVSFSCRPR